MKTSAKKAMWISVIFLVFLTGTNANATLFSGSVTGAWENVISTDPSDVYSIQNNDDSLWGNGVAQFNWGEEDSTRPPGLITNSLLMVSVVIPEKQAGKRKKGLRFFWEILPTETDQPIIQQVSMVSILM